MIASTRRNDTRFPIAKKELLRAFFKKIIVEIKLLWNSYLLDPFKRAILKFCFKMSIFIKHYKLYPLECLNI